MRLFISGVLAGVSASFGCLALHAHEPGFVFGIVVFALLSVGASQVID